MIKYIELKTGYSHNGPAWIGSVTLSKSGITIYFNGKAYKKESGVEGNYVEVESGDVYWISNVKKNGADRHWSGSGKVMLDRSIAEEYLNTIKAEEIDLNKCELTDDIVATDTAKYHKTSN